MLIALSVAMFIVPSLFSLSIHDYLRHGEVSRIRKIVLLIVYLLLINAITFTTSYIRGA